MKKIFFFMLIAIPSQVFSQGALNKFKQKVKDRLEQRTNEGTDKEIDVAGKNSTPVDTPEVNVTVEEKQRGSKDVPAFESYSRYDFLPGAQLVYTEDFSQDVVGEFPLLWSTNNRGEVVTIKSQPGKWLRMFQGGHFIGPEVKKLPDNFTVEFDMVLNFAEEGYVYPSILFKMLEPIDQGKDGRKYLADPNAFANAGITIAPAEGGNSTINLSTDHNGENYFNSGQKNLKKLDANYGIPFHVAM
jgi:OmpA-OmpF porin, OOP family